MYCSAIFVVVGLLLLAWLLIWQGLRIGGQVGLYATQSHLCSPVWVPFVYVPVTQSLNNLISHLQSARYAENRKVYTLMLTVGEGIIPDMSYSWSWVCVLPARSLNLRSMWMWKVCCNFFHKSPLEDSVRWVLGLMLDMQLEVRGFEFDHWTQT